MTPAGWSRFRRAARVAGACLLLLPAGCRADALVTVAVDGPGGEVTARFEADRDAVAVVGGPSVVAQGAQVADLRRAGWEVVGPRRTKAGGAVVTASKAFDRPEELGPLVEELAGPGGPLQGFRLDRGRGLTRVRYRLTGQMHLGEDRGGLLTGFANDPGLARRLQDAGVDPRRVAELLTERAIAGFRLALVVDLPGREPVRFAAEPGKRPEVSVSSTAPDRVRPALLALAAVLAVAAAAVLKPGRRVS